MGSHRRRRRDRSVKLQDQALKDGKAATARNASDPSLNPTTGTDLGAAPGAESA